MGNTVEKESNPVRIGILGAARISTDALINPSKKLKEVVIAGVASRDSAKASAFARKHSIPKFYSSYEELLNDKDIDAIYNPLPNGLHCEWTIKALEAGKHVLCEKPFASNAEEAEKMKKTADERPELVLMEAVHYRYHPATIRLKEIVSSGEIGSIQSVDASFAISKYLSPLFSQMKSTDIRFQYNLAGGVMMDAGFYPLNVIRWMVGKEPTEVTSATAQLISPQVDSAMEAQLQFDGNVTAKLKASFRDSSLIGDISVTVKGDKGQVSMFNFLVPHFYHKITVQVGNTSRVEKVPGESTYYYQLKSFVEQIRGGERSTTDAEDAVKNMRVIDAIYEKAGLIKRGQKLPDT